MTLTEFLLSRIAEDETEANVMLRQYREGGDVASRRWRRVLAECEAKRRIISTLMAWDPDPVAPERVETVEHDAWRMLSALALPYADHPDYDEAWRP